MTPKQRASCLFDRHIKELEKDHPTFKCKTDLDHFKYKKYAELRDSDYPMSQSQRDYINSLYGKHHEFIGNDFAENFPRDHYAGMWKLALCEFIRSHENIKLSVPNGNKNNNSKPDYLIKIDDKDLHVYLLSCNPSIEDIDNPQGHDSHYYKSFCNALSEHSKHKMSINDAAGCIIAISLAWVPLDRFGFSIMDELTCSLQPDDNKDIIKLHEPKARDFKKFFEENTHVSAILVLPTRQMFFPVEERLINPNYTKSPNIYCLFHNPSAKIPFPEKQLNASFEYTRTQHIRRCHAPKEGLDKHYEALYDLHRMVYGDNEDKSPTRGVYDEILSSIDNHITYKIIILAGKINESTLHNLKQQHLQNCNPNSGRNLTEIIAENNKIKETTFLTENQHFNYFCFNNYFSSQLSAIRRLSDNHPKSNSLQRIFKNLKTRVR